jgi:hypothetical protein
MSEPTPVGAAPSGDAAQLPPQPSGTTAPSANTLDLRAVPPGPPRKRRTVSWHTTIVSLAVSAILCAGLVAGRQILVYGSLTPSIAGSWYGAFWAAQPVTGKFTNTYNLYVQFALDKGNHLSATTSSCSASGMPLYTQASTPGLTFAGTFTGTHFTMTPVSSQTGDVESDLAWVGAYSPDQVHIDFSVNGLVTQAGSYANLRRGSYDDFVRTCKVPGAVRADAPLNNGLLSSAYTYARLAAS